MAEEELHNDFAVRELRVCTQRVGRRGGVANGGEACCQS